MSKYCKYCKHSEEESEMTNNLALGVALGTFFFPEWKTVLKCKNYKSTFYYDKVDEYNSCTKFEEK